MDLMISEQNQDVAYEAVHFNIKKWMVKKKLKISDEKKKFVLILTRWQLKRVEHHPIAIEIGKELICPVNSSRNLGYWLDP